MMQFGEPTTSAHGKIIYWAYGENGKISEDDLEKARKKNAGLNVLATVKFNSNGLISGSSEKDEKLDVYFLITSEPMLKKYLNVN